MSDNQNVEMDEVSRSPEQSDGRSPVQSGADSVSSNSDGPI